MVDFTDYQLKMGEYGTSKKYEDEDAIVLAIRNILLSRPGNFPFNPSIGMNIKQYSFELLDEQLLSDIKSELNRQIAEYIPSIGNVKVDVLKIEDELKRPYLCFSIGSNIDGEEVQSNFILKQEGNNVEIFNEIN